MIVGFHKCLSDLLKLRAQKHKEEIGFVSQPSKEVAEVRKQQLHEARVRLANARASHLEIDSDIRQTIEAPLPGHVRIPSRTLRYLQSRTQRRNAKYQAKLGEKRLDLQPEELAP
jgi:hypothetical protein